MNSVFQLILLTIRHFACVQRDFWFNEVALFSPIWRPNFDLAWLLGQNKMILRKWTRTIVTISYFDSTHYDSGACGEIRWRCVKLNRRAQAPYCNERWNRNVLATLYCLWMYFPIFSFSEQIKFNTKTFIAQHSSSRCRVMPATAPTALLDTSSGSSGVQNAFVHNQAIYIAQCTRVNRSSGIDV